MSDKWCEKRHRRRIADRHSNVTSKSTKKLSFTPRHWAVTRRRIYVAPVKWYVAWNIIKLLTAYDESFNVTTIYYVTIAGAVKKKLEFYRMKKVNNPALEYTYSAVLGGNQFLVRSWVCEFSYFCEAWIHRIVLAWSIVGHLVHAQCMPRRIRVWEWKKTVLLEYIGHTSSVWQSKSAVAIVFQITIEIDWLILR